MPVNLSSGELTEEEARLLLEEKRLLTAEGGEVEVPRKIEKAVALFDDGLFLVQREFLYSPHVLDFEQRLRKRGVHLGKKTPISLTSLQTIMRLEQERGNLSTGGTAGSVRAEAPMQRAFYAILEEASSMGASDLHVVVEPERAILRLRVDGVLQDYKQYDSAHGRALCVAAFNWAEISDTSYADLARQNAQISSSSGKLPKGIESIRMAFTPSARGRYMVVRIQPERSDTGDIGALLNLGYSQKHIDALNRMRGHREGLVIVAGPTGSGKTTTLVAMLTAHNYETKRRFNFLTIEDPPEKLIGGGVVQMPVTNATSKEDRADAFGEAIMQALRLDPDVIMIGEVRDKESGDLAFKAGMSGHMVYTTLHANSAAKILPRLRDLGVEKYKVADSDLVVGLVAQRLVPTLCKHCCIPFSEADVRRIGQDRYDRFVRRYEGLTDRIFVAGTGCARCKHTGVGGRTLVAETIEPNDAFMEAIAEGDNNKAKRIWLNEMGGFTYLDHAELKILDGLICPAEAEMALGRLPETPYPTSSSSRAA